MKKIISIFIAMTVCLSLAACGGASGKRDEALSGKYIAVMGTALGVTLSSDTMSGFTLELKSDGKVSLSVDDIIAKGKWVSDDTTVTITVENTDMVGTLGEDTITFENFLEKQAGTAMDITFAKEGTDAAKPENFLPEDEKALLGEWTGVSVVDVLEDDASSEVSPSNIKATLNSDHTATVNYNGTDNQNITWNYYADTVTFDGGMAGGASLYGEYKDDVFKITYTDDDSYYTFTMEK